MEDGRPLISFAGKKEDVKNEGREDDRFAGTSASLRRFENKKEDDTLPPSRLQERPKDERTIVPHMRNWDEGRLKNTKDVGRLLALLAKTMDELQNQRDTTASP